MSRATISTLVLLAFAGAFTLAEAAIAEAPKLTAVEIVDRNLAARGGLEKLRGLRTMSWSGMMDAGGGNRPPVLGIPGQAHTTQTAPQAPAPQLQLPFVLEMMRGHKSRLEITFNGQTAIQVYDGKQGWKLRPFLNRHDVESFTADELQAVQNQSDLDGRLVDYAAQGTKLEADGVDKVEGKDAYKLKLTLKGGQVVHEWIDAQSFLEVKVDGTPRKLDRKPHAVSILLRDYRSVDGLMIPHLIETDVQGVQRAETIRIEKVLVNPRLAESRFAKPT